MRTIFAYRYRDAGNFKASGSAPLEGILTPQQKEAIRMKLRSGEFFIAEQIGVLPLYDQLYPWSDGPIGTDHCWHEFVGFEETGEMDEGSELAEPGAAFVARFTAIADWDEALSPHFDLRIRRKSCT